MTGIAALVGVTTTDDSPWFAVITTSICLFSILALAWIGARMRAGDKR